MLFKHWKAAAFVAISVASQVDAGFGAVTDRSNDGTASKAPNKDQFIDSLISKMSVSDLGKLDTHTRNKIEHLEWLMLCSLAAASHVRR
jgi:hypothetical protein